MLNLISRQIERLRSFISGSNRKTPIETPLADTITLPEEHARGIGPERSDKAVLGADGIHFQGVRYQSADLNEMLSWMGPGHTVKVMIKDPSDPSSIFVWNSGARPAPRWIRVPAAAPEGGPSGGRTKRTSSLPAPELKRMLAHFEGGPCPAIGGRPQGRKPSKSALTKAKRTKTSNAAAAKAKTATRVSKIKHK
ncbi:Mu transposase C-terminal domain-containing protein [Bradyrhizobium sp. BRP20]|uniref:Mu transposase C-terminal domain-containing protein n=1 Tax=Bradyrhizobium sp. BRP20 TaxID=2793822 RepID=UPI001CD26BE9|nr:Mu transposase C-terminal domain-containing protein [Bradyrhizobium sp. BRP20]MCA1436782.1 Mu transposase C-terminal domain-containing protein [Bradyrhizobium sp. BRP20]